MRANTKNGLERQVERQGCKDAKGLQRAKITGDYTDAIFRTGMYLAAGMIFGIRGLLYGIEMLFSPDITIATNTSYLLQIYGGYFLKLLLILFFCVACKIWSTSQIDYALIFEFDTHHILDWRQLAELPCFCLFLLGLFIWLNFTGYGAESLFLYYPVILVGLTAMILCFPAPIIYYQSRKWCLYSTWRLVLSGIYQVEFRDVFVGDMFNSQTYSMGNIELFFCLYAVRWRSPASCSSSHSHLLGFFSTLPAIWRVFQNFRRYLDSRSEFPHLANLGKYVCTITYLVSLSLFRISRTPQSEALFICLACINSIYCTFWDLSMDWSLLNPYAKHRFLRNTLGYNQTWFYYIAIAIDPVLRLNWIVYVTFGDDVRYSPIVCFAVSLSEVCRRALWMMLRVENEHCSNIAQHVAPSDAPPPYRREDSSTLGGNDSPELQFSHGPLDKPHSGFGGSRPHLRRSFTSGADVKKETAAHTSSGAPAQRFSGKPPFSRHDTNTKAEAQKQQDSTMTSLEVIGHMMHHAHRQEYVKKLNRTSGEKRRRSDEGHEIPEAAKNGSMDLLKEFNKLKQTHLLAENDVNETKNTCPDEMGKLVKTAIGSSPPSHHCSLPPLSITHVDIRTSIDGKIINAEFGIRLNSQQTGSPSLPPPTLAINKFAVHDTIQNTLPIKPPPCQVQS